MAKQAVLFCKKEPKNSYSFGFVLSMAGRGRGIKVLALIAKLAGSGGQKQASASFLKKRSKKLLSVGPCGYAAISRRARAKPIGSCVRMTVGVARIGNGLRRKEGSGNDEWESFLGPFFSKKGLLASCLLPACYLAAR